MVLLLTLYAVYCRMLYHGHCPLYCMLHVCVMGTAAYIVCCVLLHVCAMGTAAYIVCCMFVPWALLLILYATCLCHGHCCSYCMLCTATCLCHRHCTLTVICLLWQFCLTLYVVHTLPPGFPLWALLLYM